MELTTLKVKRGGIKGKLTRFRKILESYEEKGITAIELQKRLDKIEQDCYNEYDKIQTEIELIDPNEETDRESFEDEYFKIVAEADQIIQSLNSSNQNSSNDNAVNDSVVSRSSSVVNLNNIPIPVSGLPQIKIPEFDGTHEKWMEFKDLFLSLVDLTSISDVQKLIYLKANVKNDAARIISALEISESNYTIAWALLCDRYDNKRILVHNHIRALLNINSIHKERSSQLRSVMDHVNKHIRSLKSLEQDVSGWDPLLIHIICNKLDISTAKEWEKYVCKSTNVEDLDSFLQFLKSKAEVLESIEINVTDSKNKSDTFGNKNFTKNKGVSSRSYILSKTKCSLCNETHKLFFCEKFKQLAVQDRKDHVQKNNLCENCLNVGHAVKNCKFGSCKKCPKKHNSLLHVEDVNSAQKTPPIPTNVQTSNETNSAKRGFAIQSIQSTHILLSTAIVKVYDKNNQIHYCRALLDSASESSFITENLCRILELPCDKFNIAITGITQQSSFVKERCNVTIASTTTKFAYTVSCLVVPNICENMPAQDVAGLVFKIPQNLRLADPHFHISSPIDMLLGAELFYKLLCVGQIQLGEGLPIIQKSKLGWVVAGSYNSTNNRKSSCFFTNIDVQMQLEKFWNIQELDFPNKILSQEESEFEDHFCKTFKRDSNGKFIVAIPFKGDCSVLGDSREIALKRFYNLERKLQSDNDLRVNYIKYMRDYELLGHMSQIENSEESFSSNFLSHHGVIKEDSSTTKLRIVFDASCVTASGVSINSIQMTGAILQRDLFSILLSFRLFSYVVSSDIEKMYRSIWINPKQRALQQIFWRESPSDPLSIFQLNTITHGMTSASFQAIRCLFQLAYENASEYPLASNAIKYSFYVDNFLHGADSKEELQQVCSEVFQILYKAGLNLRQWIANEASIVRYFEDVRGENEDLQIGDLEGSKTLGLFWKAKSDTLSFKIADFTNDNEVMTTKRSILSGIAHIYDPLGLLSACTVTVKIWLQELWKEKLNWDDSVSKSLHERWIKFRTEISLLNSFEIPRHVSVKGNKTVQLHGFCDASQYAYSACIYLRSVDSSNNVTVHLLCAKTKVAPLKMLTIPRLELSGALILSRLMKKVLENFQVENKDILYWTDSMIVLGWLNAQANLLKTFVANRVSEIQCNSDIKKWRHVKSGDNPADLASRGVSPQVLMHSDLWWHGPQWLVDSIESWPENAVSNEGLSLPEFKGQNKTISFVVTSQSFTLVPEFNRFSKFCRLIRSLAYCFRFIHNIRTQSDKFTGPLKCEELQNSTIYLIKFVQQEFYKDELIILSKGVSLPSKNRLLSLDPFIDQDGILRVGGRLRNSKFMYDKKHPILIPKNHRFTKLLFQQEHIRLAHAGPQLMLSSIRNNYWVINGKSLARQIFHNCVVCFRTSPKNLIAKMGDLPSERVIPSFPFSTCGIDYAGPFFLKDKKARGSKLIKHYIALFICFTTKAIHLELVGDLSTESFIAALKRFLSRRGKPHQIFSDNGSNFVGAKNELEELAAFLKEQKDQIINFAVLEGIKWSFIPPYSPHHGGLWESGVKSCKLHLKRILGSAHLIYEEFLTLIVQIEGILNSRPLSPLSTNPNDLSPLTPSHFLIGRPITALAEPSLEDVKENRLSRYERIQQLMQHFWARWATEYINELQIRQKWRTSDGTLRNGDLVLVKEKNQPPLCWVLGRVTDLHPGKDGVVRVASISTTKGLMKRPIVNLCPLPSPEEGNVLKD